MNVKKQKSAVLTGSVSTRNVYICEIFSCYSGYQSVFLLDLCTFSQPNKCVGLKRTTILHILHSTPLCQHVVPCTIHRTATGAGNATSHSVPRLCAQRQEADRRWQTSQQPPVQVGPVGHRQGTLHYRKLWCAVKVQQRRGRITTCW